MDENPYASPSAESAAQSITPKSRRPLGVSAMALLIGFPGAAFLVTAGAMSFFAPREFARLLELKVAMFLCALSLIAAIGMWQRLRAGWFAAQVYCLWFSFAYVRALVVAETNLGPVRPIIVATHLIFVAILYLPRSREYFAIGKLAAVLSLLSATTATIALYYGMIWLGITA